MHMISEPMTARQELRQGWKLIVASAIGFGLGLSGIPFYTLGAFVDPLHNEFAWNVSAIMAGPTVQYLVFIIVLPYVGKLVDRAGSRSVALVSLCLFSLSYMCFGLSNGSLWLYYATWFAIAFTGAGTMAVTWGRALTEVFTAARGTALGLTLIGSGLTGFFGLELARWLILTIGWRSAFVALGFLPLLVAIPIVFTLFKPRRLQMKQVKVAPAGHSPAKPPLGKRFWILGFAFMLIATGVTGLVPNLIKILTTSGVGTGSAVAAASLIGLFVIFGRLACGALLDLFWAPAVASLFLLSASLACLLLFLRPLLPVEGAAAAALIGLAAGAEFDLMPYLVSRYFDIRHFASTLGGISRFFYLGAAISGPSLGLAYDRFGDYRPGLTLAAALCAAGALGLYALGRYPRPEISAR